MQTKKAPKLYAVVNKNANKTVNKCIKENININLNKHTCLKKELF